MKIHEKEKNLQGHHITLALPNFCFSVPMVYHRVSIEVKQHAAELLQRSWEADVVVEALGVSKKNICWWVLNLKQQGSVEASGSFHGRPCTLQAEIVAELVDLIHQNLSLYLDEPSLPTFSLTSTQAAAPEDPHVRVRL